MLELKILYRTDENPRKVSREWILLGIHWVSYSYLKTTCSPLCLRCLPGDRHFSIANCCFRLGPNPPNSLAIRLSYTYNIHYLCPSYPIVPSLRWISMKTICLYTSHNTFLLQAPFTTAAHTTQVFVLISRSYHTFVNHLLYTKNRDAERVVNPLQTALLNSTNHSLETEMVESLCTIQISVRWEA